MKTKLYCKTNCCWTAGVKKVLQRYQVEYDEVNVSEKQNFDYMKEQTNQTYSPCLLIDGEWIVDVGARELEDYFNMNGNFRGMLEWPKKEQIVMFTI